MLAFMTDFATQPGDERFGCSVQLIFWKSSITSSSA